MLKMFYEAEKNNRNNYDGYREYCIAERVNEDFFRTSMMQNKRKSKKVIVRLILSLLHITK